MTFPAPVLFLLLGASAADSGPADTEDVGVVTTKQEDPTVFPDPDDFAVGFFVEAAAGPAAPLGPTRPLLTPAVGAAARIGYEFRRWVALQAAAFAQIGFYDDGVIVREPFQQFTYLGQARFAVPFRRFALGAEGGAGIFHVSSNLLQIGGLIDAPRRFGVAWSAGAFLDVHTLAKGFSGGIGVSFVGTPQLRNSGTLFVQLYLRYTLGASTSERRIRRARTKEVSAAGRGREGRDSPVRRRPVRTER